MAREHEHGYKKRLLLILLAIIRQPKRYTKRELMEMFGVGEDAINNDFKALRAAGFVLRYDKRYRYYFVEDQPIKQLKELLHFSEEDQILLSAAIDHIAQNDKQGKRLKAKLASLYDYRRLGHTYLRKPYLAKLDTLLAAKENKQQVILQQYHSSNSNSIQDRQIEPFHIDPPKDTLHAYDVDHPKVKHFKISRITRIKKTENHWQYEGAHRVHPTDVFRITQKKQEMVHLRLKVGARNELVERFPLTSTYVMEAEEEGYYDFQCMVNYQFYGLSNFILGSHNHIEVLEPDSLLEHLAQEVKKMQEKWVVGD